MFGLCFVSFPYSTLFPLSKTAPTHVTCLIIYVTWLCFFFTYLSHSHFLLTVASLVVFDMRILSKYLLPVLLSRLVCLRLLRLFLYRENYVTRLPTCLNMLHLSPPSWIPFGRTSHSLERGVFFCFKQALRHGATRLISWPLKKVLSVCVVLLSQAL